MERLHRLIALIVAALWLPAVVHCGVEALDLSAAPEDRCCEHEPAAADGAGGACLADHCGVFDEGHFRGGEAADPVDAPVRLALAWVAQGWLRCEPQARLEPASGWPPGVAECAAAWVFVRRAAPWANAPDLRVA